MTSLPFWAALALLGFQPWMILTQQAISLIYQFWIHTERIGRLPAPIEFVFNTPSHHRVHHGSNELYLDRNYGGILIVWDRLFGTFQGETERVAVRADAEPPHLKPIRVAFHEFAAIARDVRGAGSWRDRLGYMFRGPGWSPDGRGGGTRGEAAMRVSAARARHPQARPGGALAVVRRAGQVLGGGARRHADDAAFLDRQGEGVVDVAMEVDASVACRSAFLRGLQAHRAEAQGAAGDVEGEHAYRSVRAAWRLKPLHLKLAGAPRMRWGIAQEDQPSVRFFVAARPREAATGRRVSDSGSVQSGACDRMPEAREVIWAVNALHRRGELPLVRRRPSPSSFDLA